MDKFLLLCVLASGAMGLAAITMVLCGEIVDHGPRFIGIIASGIVGSGIILKNDADL
jgi:hypothetical protein